jgi:transcriptional regulator with XRE-family HTH domain
MQPVDDPRQMARVDTDLSGNVALHTLRLEDCTLQGGDLRHVQNIRVQNTRCQAIAQGFVCRAVARLLHEALPALREQAGLSQEELAFRTRDADGKNGVSIESIKTYERPSRAGAVPEVEILEALGRGLGLDAAEVFYEYPIAAARRAARPGVSQRRARVTTPSDALVEEVEDAAQQRGRQRPLPASASKRRKGKGRAA